MRSDWIVWLLQERVVSIGLSWDAFRTVEQMGQKSCRYLRQEKERVT